MKHGTWIAQITEGDSEREIARKAGFSNRTLNSQLQRDRISAENVIAIAIAYGHHPVGALVDTGYLDEQWAQQIDPARILQEVSEEQLAYEVLRRMKIGAKTDYLTTDVNELAARRARRAGGGDGSTPTVPTEAYAADSTPDEDELRWEYGEDPID
ncbi:hypothetical protein H7347_07385 [Corynebacterium sp. zg-331]|uniref:hypothetical protein n=1 Tax=unclassified Corynebacterium TaxID=2624378 RepID=UPI00128C167E|nr:MULTISPECIES: hypothetical protein [unclassified Corynebacterium]MBC3186396.1 hypothetical protein [Corynebacterium sp. zg-331]MPV52882.1 hypothetical protein [Corynebacterium sp. zg331]